jgi:peroxiredoxin
MILTVGSPRPVSPGERAPDFTLPAVDGEQLVSLDDYRGRSALFLSLLIGLWCPFCRRHLALMNALNPKLNELGVESVGVVATSPENARLYFRFRPSKLKIAADPQLTTHSAYGLPRPNPTPDFVHALETTLVNPFGDLPQALPVTEAAAAVAKTDGYTETDADRADLAHQWPQFKGQFLIDRDGIVRWTYIECAADGVAGVGKFPPVEEVLAAAHNLPQS